MQFAVKGTFYNNSFQIDGIKSVIRETTYLYRITPLNTSALEFVITRFNCANVSLAQESSSMLEKLRSPPFNALLLSLQQEKRLFLSKALPHLNPRLGGLGRTLTET